VDGGEGLGDVVDDVDHLSKSVLLLGNVRQTGRANVGSGSVGLVIGLVVALTEVSLAKGGRLLRRGVGLDVDPVNEDVVSDAESTAKLCPVRTDCVGVVDPRNNGRTIRDYVRENVARLRVATKAEVC
jgi:hypothetical protein